MWSVTKNWQNKHKKINIYIISLFSFTVKTLPYQATQDCYFHGSFRNKMLTEKFEF